MMTQSGDAFPRPLAADIAAFGRKLEAYRLARGIRQEDLAEQAGLSRSTLHRLETGKGGTLDSLFRVMRALELGERLDSLVPDAEVSPLDPRSAEPRRRQRATGPRKSVAKDQATDWSWGE